METFNIVSQNDIFVETDLFYLLETILSWVFFLQKRQFFTTVQLCHQFSWKHSISSPKRKFLWKRSISFPKKRFFIETFNFVLQKMGYPRKWPIRSKNRFHPSSNEAVYHILHNIYNIYFLQYEESSLHGKTLRRNASLNIVSSSIMNTIDSSSI